MWGWAGGGGGGGGGGAWRTPLAHDLLQLHTDCKLIVGLIMKVCETFHSTSSTSDEIHIFFNQQFWLNREYESGNQVHVVKMDFIHYNDVIMRAMVPNHQPHDCLLNRLFRCRSKKTSKLRVTGLCAGNSPATGEFPAQKSSSTENGSIWWHHHVCESSSATESIISASTTSSCSRHNLTQVSRTFPYIVVIMLYKLISTDKTWTRITMTYWKTCTTSDARLIPLTWITIRSGLKC